MGGCTSSVPAPPEAPAAAPAATAAPAPAAPAGGAAPAAATTTAATTAATAATAAPAAPAAATATATAPATPSAAATEQDDGDDAPESVRVDATPQNTNVEATSEVVEDWPLMRYGQLTKQSGTGIVKNWRRRNFTCEKGILKYYELFTQEYPFGEREKGCFALTGYTVIEEGLKEPTQILLKSAEQTRQFDLLVQADDQKKKNTWVTIFKEHVAYADKYKIKAPEKLEQSHKTSSRF